MIIDATDYAHEPTPWTTRAACRGITEPDLFFLDHGQSPAQAKAVCAGCPVRQECLDYAVRWRINDGIWGGTTPRERRLISRAAPRPHHFPPRHGTTGRYHIGCRCQRCIEATMAYLAESRS